jgi:hypothetical protein
LRALQFTSVISMDAQSTDPRHDFEANPTIEEIIAQQGKGPIDISALHKNARPDDEPIENFLTANAVTLDPDFVAEVEQIVHNRKPWNPPSWD